MKFSLPLLLVTLLRANNDASQDAEMWAIVLVENPTEGVSPDSPSFDVEQGGMSPPSSRPPRTIDTAVSTDTTVSFDTDETDDTDDIYVIKAEAESAPALAIPVRELAPISNQLVTAEPLGPLDHLMQNAFCLFDLTDPRAKKIAISISLISGASVAAMCSNRSDPAMAGFATSAVLYVYGIYRSMVVQEQRRNYYSGTLTIV